MKRGYDMQMIVCPSCHYEEFPDTAICSHCGEPLDSRSVDEYANRQDNSNQINPESYSGYRPIGNRLSDNQYQNPYQSGSTPQQLQKIEQDDIEDDIAEFVGDNIRYYRQKWRDGGRNSTNISFNFNAYLLPYYWFGYRKMYPQVLIFSLIIFFAYLAFYFAELNSDNPLSIFIFLAISVLSFGMTVICGWFTNLIYRRRAWRIVTATRKLTNNKAERLRIYQKKGGTSILGIFINFLSYFVAIIAPIFIISSTVDSVELIGNGVIADNVPVKEVMDTLFTEQDWVYLDGAINRDIIQFTAIYHEDGRDYFVKIIFAVPRSKKSFSIEEFYIDWEEVPLIAEMNYYDFLYGLYLYHLNN